MAGGVPDPDLWRGTPVVVTGGAGFVGRPTVRLLEGLGADVRVVRSAEFDLREPRACEAALDGAEVVVHLAARVGGIGYNRRNPGLLAHDNLVMGCNVFEAARRRGVHKLVVAGTVCSYPKHTPVPFREADLWSGYPEETNAPYGIAKKAMIVLSDAYRRQYGLDSCVPVLVNLYGPGDNFDLEDSHVIPAMIHRYVLAVERGDPEVPLWGTGRASREFLYVDDAARALVLAAERLGTSEPVNVGTGRETAIRDLAAMIAELTGFDGDTVWDSSKPDGQPVRCLDVSRARDLLGFEAQVAIEDGLSRTVESFRATRLAGDAA
jgi:GDP-L-fucose synthase